MTTTDTTFDLRAELPAGRLAIQASAGTGKTYALAALATRFVAEEGVPASELLIVTFTRAATAELRTRVRERLLEAAEHLEAGAPADSGDQLLDQVADASLAERAVRLERLQRAVAEFDAATITTIHGFATQVRASLGATAGPDRDAALVDDHTALVAEVCADVLARAATDGHPAEDLPTHGALVSDLRITSSVADLALVPHDGQDGASRADLLRARLARECAEAIDQRRRREGAISFNDVLTELRDALEGPGAAATIEALRARYRVALIDEFQDTDPVQWDIFDTLFGAGAADAHLVLVGDPKQAIYSFRGADVRTYLRAVDADTGVARRTLDTNWRSDGALLTALRTLLDGTTYGDEHIRFAPVTPSDRRARDRLTGTDGTALPAVQLRLALAPDIKRKRDSVEVDPDGAASAIDADLVHEVRHLLDHGLLPDGTGTRPVRPPDLAVLVRTGEEARKAQAALVEQGVPAVLARGTSVLDSPAAQQWRIVLDALVRPADPRRARTFALSWFGGWSAAEVDAAGDLDLSGVQEQLHTWASVLLRQGVAAFIRTVRAESGVVARVLGGADGDRNVTDLDHLGELLQGAVAGGRSSVAGLLTVLDAAPVEEADADRDGDKDSRRIESEAEAVQIMTIWVAKGLEFPIVLCPSLWRFGQEGDPVYEDPDTGVRTFDVSRNGSWPDSAEAAARKRLVEQESEGERLRLLYVALTRAQHHTVVWWTRALNSDRTALARVLFARRDGVLDPDAYGQREIELPDDDDVLDALQPLVDAAEGTIATTIHGRPGPPAGPWHDPDAPAAPAALQRAVLPATPDRRSHRWSFSAITSRVETTHFDPLDDTLADRGAADEGGDEPAPGAIDAVPAAPPAEAPPFAFVPAGAALGTLVHAVYEEVDFTEVDLTAALSDELGRQLAFRPLDLTPVGVEGATSAEGRTLLVAGMQQAIETPLGPQLGGLRLRDLARTDRLDELSFELLLGGGPRQATDRDLGALVARHLPPGHGLHAWATQLEAGAFGVDLTGHLTGSIDAVLRVPGEGGAPRYVVVDYKTNRLTPWGEAPGADDYHPRALAVAMAAHHYPLQALLYAAALHRYLRWRQPGYDPAVHLGGAAYLFLRGMTGGEVAVSDGQPHGVFSWATPPALVVELSDLLAGDGSGTGVTP
jgi:exodeoxyribonuclease V beta subunit